MATAEGIFPKDVAGTDPLYASEGNRFARAGLLIAMGSFAPLTSGTTAGSVLGSVLVSGTNQTGRYTDLNIWATIERGGNTAGSTIQNVAIKLSGVGLGNIPGNLSTGSNLTVDISSTASFNLHANILVGSIFTGLGYVRATPYPLANTVVGRQSNIEQFSLQPVNHFNTGSPYVIFFTLGDNGDSSATVNTQILSYTVQASRGVLNTTAS